MTNEQLLQVRSILKTLIPEIKPDSRELSLVVTKLEEASMWLGKDMTIKNIFKPYTDEQQTSKEI